MKYDEETLKTLRYGSIMIMADQDFDGSHIKGLIMNFLHWYNPSLLRLNGFVKMFITPIVKATKGSVVKSFFTVPKFVAWKNAQNSLSGWTFKYYKGLGTNTSKEAKTYFGDLNRHVIPFRYNGGTTSNGSNNDDETTALLATPTTSTTFQEPSNDDDWIEMVFSKTLSNRRKTWLQSYDSDSSIDYETNEISVSTFLRDEYVVFECENSLSHVVNRIICITLVYIRRKSLEHANAHSNVT